MFGSKTHESRNDDTAKQNKTEFDAGYDLNCLRFFLFTSRIVLCGIVAWMELFDDEITACQVDESATSNGLENRDREASSHFSDACTDDDPDGRGKNKCNEACHCRTCYQVLLTFQKSCTDSVSHRNFMNDDWSGKYHNLFDFMEHANGQPFQNTVHKQWEEENQDWCWRYFWWLLLRNFNHLATITVYLIHITSDRTLLPGFVVVLLIILLNINLANMGWIGLIHWDIALSNLLNLDHLAHRSFLFLFAF